VAVQHVHLAVNTAADFIGKCGKNKFAHRLDTSENDAA
jgi:hypothetical protein